VRAPNFPGNRKLRGRLSGTIVAVAHLGWAAAASAQTPTERETARALMDRGDEQIAQGDLMAALAAYRAADAIMHVPTTGVEVARTYARLGRLVEARDAALQVLRTPSTAGEPKPFQVARDEASELSRNLGEQIPTLVVEVRPLEISSNASLSVDGNRVPSAALGLPYRLNPGEHQLSLSAPGYEVVDISLLLALREHRVLPVTLQPLPAAEPIVTQKVKPAALPAEAHSAPVKSNAGDGALPWPVWVGASVAGAGVIVGTVAGIVSLEHAKDARQLCNGNDCPEAARPDRDAALTTASVSNVGWVFAGVGAAVSLTSFLLSAGPGKAKPTTNLALTTVSGGGMLHWQEQIW
jgi:hypothetical protein